MNRTTRRLCALGALVCAVGALAVTVAVLWENWAPLLGAMVLVLVALAAAWYVVTRRGVVERSLERAVVVGVERHREDGAGERAAGGGIDLGDDQRAGPSVVGDGERPVGAEVDVDRGGQVVPLGRHGLGDGVAPVGQVDRVVGCDRAPADLEPGAGG